MDVVRRIQKEQLDDDFEIRDVSPLSTEILAKTFPYKFNPWINMIRRLTRIATY